MYTTTTFATCDHPNCAATGEVLLAAAVPAGWRFLSSTGHLTKAIRYSVDDPSRGVFTLQFCPAHVDYLDAHLPQTIGLDEGGVEVTCSCGGLDGRAQGYTQIAPRPVGPDLDTERVWWSHLPVQLQAYFLAEAAGAA
jgi:hypothetical protein